MGNAALAYRDEYEDEVAPVISTEVLEVNVVSIRADVNELKREFREFRTEFHAVIKRIDDDIKAAVTRLEAEIRSMAEKAENDLEKFAARVDRQLLEMRQDMRDMRAHDKALRERVDGLDKKIDHIGTELNVLLWFVGGLGTLATIFVTVGKAFHWF